MNGVRFFLFISLITIYNTTAQQSHSSFSAHKSLADAIRINNEIIEGRTLFFEKQAEKKPLMFQKTKLRVSELNRLSNNLSKYIVELQSKVNTERVLYDLLESEHYKELLFSYDNALSYKGKKLKRKIDSLYNHALKINVHKLSQLENFYEARFNTEGDFFDSEQNKLNYFDYLFHDKSNYGIMMAMNYLLLDVKTFQLLYFGSVMSY